MNLSCDLKKAVKVSYLDGNFFTGDSYPISVTVTDNGEPASISGSVSAFVIKDDNSMSTITGGSVSGNVVTITIPGTALDVPGRVSIAVRLTTGSTVTTLAVLVANIF